jgi:uncharacterized membrane protein YidH (DUF202 family)
MRCADLRNPSPERPHDEAELAAHLASCPECDAWLAGSWAPEALASLEACSGGESTEQAAEVAIRSDELRARLREERGPVAWLRSRATKERYVLAFGVAVLAAAVQWHVARRVDLASYPVGAMVITLGGYLVGIAYAARVALRSLAEPPSRPATSSLLLGALVLAPVLFAALPIHGAVELGGDKHAAHCFGYGLAIGVLVAGAWSALSRSYRWEGLVFGGLGAALTGNLLLQLSCPARDPLHLLLGHAALVIPWVALAVLRPLAQRLPRA